MKKRGIALSLGIFATLLAAGVFELSFFLLNPRFEVYFSLDRPSPKPVPEGAYSLNTDFGGPSIPTRPPTVIDKIEVPHVVYDKQFYYFDDGLVFGQEGTYSAIASRLSDGEVAFRATYTLGPSGFRITPQQGKKSEYAILVGDSLTFGSGVNDSETMAVAFARKQERYHVYNFSFPRYALNTHLLNIQKRNLKPLVKESTGVVAYIYNSDHVTRTLGSYNYIRRYGYSHPYFVRDPSGTPRYLGSFEEAAPFQTWLAKVLNGSQIVRYFNLDWKINTDPKWPELFADCVLALKRQYLNQFPNSRFVFVVSPGENHFVHDILPALDHRKINVLDYSYFNLRGRLQGLMRIPGDGHYTPEANKVWGEQLAHDFMRAFPVKSETMDHAIKKQR
jgi:hypothetical protein